MISKAIAYCSKLCIALGTAAGTAVTYKVALPGKEIQSWTLHDQCLTREWNILGDNTQVDILVCNVQGVTNSLEEGNHYFILDKKLNKYGTTVNRRTSVAGNEEGWKITLTRDSGDKNYLVIHDSKSSVRVDKELEGISVEGKSSSKVYRTKWSKTFEEKTSNKDQFEKLVRAIKEKAKELVTGSSFR